MVLNLELSKQANKMDQTECHDCDQAMVDLTKDPNRSTPVVIRRYSSFVASQSSVALITSSLHHSELFLIVVFLLTAFHGVQTTNKVTEPGDILLGGLFPIHQKGQFCFIFFTLLSYSSSQYYRKSD